MARFRNLVLTATYDIIDGKTGYWRTQGISGADAMSSDNWKPTDEAYAANEITDEPIEIAD